MTNPAGLPAGHRAARFLTDESTKLNGPSLRRMPDAVVSDLIALLRPVARKAGAVTTNRRSAIIFPVSNDVLRKCSASLVEHVACSLVDYGRGSDLALLHQGEQFSVSVSFTGEGSYEDLAGVMRHAFPLDQTLFRLIIEAAV